MRLALAAALALTLAVPAAFSQAPAPAMPKAVADPAAAPAGTYALDKRHASLAMQLSHFGFSNYTFLLRGLDGRIVYDPASPAAAKVSITADPTTVDTGLPDFDTEIGTDARFFDGGTHKTVTFTSTGLQITGGNKGRLTGDLTLKGVTKPVTLDVTFNGASNNMRGVPTMGFSATGKIKRSDFGVASHLPAAVVGDEVTLVIEAEFNKSA